MEEFKVLSDRDHVLQRPNVYLGSVTAETISGIVDYKYQSVSIVPALIKMCEEVIQNSIDEHIRTSGEYATKIDVKIEYTLEGVEISVSDNGRGIPIEMVNGNYRPIHAWTSLRAGSNFDDSTRVGAGTNGMGVSLVNIFSIAFTGFTSNGKDAITVECSDNMEHIKHKLSKSKHQGTTVSFVPDLVRFGLTEFTEDHLIIIRDRLVNFAIMFPKIVFSFNSEKIHFKNLKQVAKNYNLAAVSYETSNVGMVFAPAGDDEEFRLLSYANGIYIKNGGSHIDYILNLVIADLREHIRKKYKIDVLPNAVKQHLLFASWMSNFPALRFDSQSKERVTNSNSEVAEFLKDIDFDKIAKQILNTPEILDPMIAAILYKKEMADKLALAKKQKSATKLRVVNHIAATDSNPENRRLFLVEGNSALGPHIAVRNPKTDGGFPLRGKVMNVRGMKPLDILKNKEISEMLSIIGLEFGKPAKNLNYGKIILFSDLDYDGAHIFGLLLNLFSNWPELFTENRIYRCLAPLYYCTKGKIVKSFYTKEEFDQFNSKGYDVQFFKGLGSMPKEVYKECLQNSVLVKVTAEEADFDKLEMFFGNDSNGRKDWMTQ